MHTTDRVSRVAMSSIFHARRHHYPGENDSARVSLCFPNRRRPSPYCRRVGSRIAHFEACSAFTHVPACMVAELINAALRHRSASVHVVTSMSCPGCYQPKTTIVGWDSQPPPGRRAFPRRTAIFGLGGTFCVKYATCKVAGWMVGSGSSSRIERVSNSWIVVCQVAALFEFVS